MSSKTGTILFNELPNPSLEPIAAPWAAPADFFVEPVEKVGEKHFMENAKK